MNFYFKKPVVILMEIWHDWGVSVYDDFQDEGSGKFCYECVLVVVDSSVVLRWVGWIGRSLKFIGDGGQLKKMVKEKEEKINGRQTIKSMFFSQSCQINKIHNGLFDLVVVDWLLWILFKKNYFFFLGLWWWRYEDDQENERWWWRT